MLLLHGEVDNGNCCGKSLSSERGNKRYAYLSD